MKGSKTMQRNKISRYDYDFDQMDQYLFDDDVRVADDELRYIKLEKQLEQLLINIHKQARSARINVSHA